MTDGETLSSGIKIPDRTSRVDNTLPMTQSPSDFEDIEGRSHSVSIDNFLLHLHPSHEVAVSTEDSLPYCGLHSESEKSVVITRAASGLGLTPDMIRIM
jgi:hypothetical protein